MGLTRGMARRCSVHPSEIRFRKFDVDNHKASPRYFQLSLHCVPSCLNDRLAVGNIVQP